MARPNATTFYRVIKSPPPSVNVYDICEEHVCVGVTPRFFDATFHKCGMPPHPFADLKKKFEEKMKNEWSIVVTGVFHREASVYQVVWGGATSNPPLRRTADGEYDPKLRWVDEISDEQWKEWTTEQTV
jgi:hypothetical protein